jgi:hypothetical protein
MERRDVMKALNCGCTQERRKADDGDDRGDGSEQLSAEAGAELLAP